MPEPVQQTISGWDAWPADVVDRLRKWNEGYLLSFRMGDDFRCGGGCGRMIASHPRGNAVVRATKKSSGTPVCEDCLIAFARRRSSPPLLGLQGVVKALQRKLDRQLGDPQGVGGTQPIASPADRDRRGLHWPTRGAGGPEPSRNPQRRYARKVRA